MNMLIIHKNKEKGLVSIISVILIVLIITVITLSLASLTRRGLRQSLDEQLSAQAQYAAETGVNDAVEKLKANSQYTASDCSQTGGSDSNNLTNNVLNAEKNIRYTCVTVNPLPTNLNTDVTPSGIKSYLIKDYNNNPIKSLTLNWGSTNTGASVNVTTPCTTTSGCFAPSSSWGDRLGVLRARLISTAAKNTSTNKVLDIIAYPGAKESNVTDEILDGSSSPKSKLLFAKCSNGKCEVSINNLPNVSPPDDYYLQLYSYYKDINVTITGVTYANVDVVFKGAQASIDSTGASGDVLKRVRVTVPLGSSSTLSNYNNLPPFNLIVGDELCKRFYTNSSVTAEDTTGYPAGFTCNPF